MTCKISLLFKFLAAATAGHLVNESAYLPRTTSMFTAMNAIKLRHALYPNTSPSLYLDNKELPTEGVSHPVPRPPILQRPNSASQESLLPVDK